MDGERTLCFDCAKQDIEYWKKQYRKYCADQKEIEAIYQ
jgi:hypothetical protein